MLESAVAGVQPTFEALLADLKHVRRAGVGRLRGLRVSALRASAVLLDICDTGDEEPAPIADLLRRAADELGGGVEQEAVEYLLGLRPGSALWESGERRQKAASLYGVLAETFRKRPEHGLMAQVAEAILGLLHDARLRHARTDMDALRHPADSRLAVQWVERFEAYYRIWTPVYALAANLEAALTTYLDEPADHYPWDPDSAEPYDPTVQARGYARSALYNYAQFLLELKRFMSRHGGLWLASDADIEQQIGDAVYRVGWHNDLNDEDDSWLRRHLASSQGEETEHFWNVIRAFPQGIHIHDRWQQMVLKGVGLEDDTERQSASQAWLTIQACHDYTDLVDTDWRRVADWYRVGVEVNRLSGVDGARLYGQMLGREAT